MKNSPLLFLIPACMALPAAAQITGGSCSASSLNGAYALTMSGRAVSASGAFTAVSQSNGLATFDGHGSVTFNLTANTNVSAGKALTYSGTYSVASTCSGTVTITTGDAATFSIAVYAQGKTFTLMGQDAAYVYSGNGILGPTACITASMSGAYAFSLIGFTLSGTTITGVEDSAGLAQFDGQGNFTATFNISSGGTITPLTATGTYTVAANCRGTAAMTDSASVSYTAAFTVTNTRFEDFDLIIASSQAMLDGTAHSTFVNPTGGVVNVSSYATEFTPPGSVFAMFGQNLATKTAQPTQLPLPTNLLTTTVTVNGEAAPLFYVDPLQIDAQMPWDITPGWATVIVKNGNSSSAAAVFVPSAGPGISVYGTNRAVVVNSDGVTVNGTSTPAKPGDEVVAYFTGGGPVQTPQKSGSGAPDPLTKITGNATVTVGSANANIAYIGLTQGGIGLYQVNFFIPQLAKGSYPLQISIGGQKSNTPLVAVGN